MQYSFVICGVLTLLFALLIYSRKQKELEHWLLALIFLLLTINCAYVFCFFNNEASFHVFIFSELNYAIPLLYGPLFYYYTKALTTQDFKMKAKDRLHFLPFLIFFIIVLTDQLIPNGFLPDNAQHGYPFPKLILTPLYFFASIFLIRRYHKGYLEEYSYEQESNLIWLNWIITGAIVLWVIASVGYVLNLFREHHKIMIYDYYTLSFLAFFMFALAFIAIKKTNLFVFASTQKEESGDKRFALPPDLESESGDHETENLEVDALKADKASLLKIMEEDQPYLNPVLSLAKLSELSNIPSYRLTKVLKTSEGSFYDFVNKYRVEHIKLLLDEGKAAQYSILALAMDSGFNSKASFNRVFKKHVGMTPSNYLRSIT